MIRSRGENDLIRGHETAGQRERRGGKHPKITITGEGAEVGKKRRAKSLR